MHIMEGFLPLEWAVFWTIVCVPFLILGIKAMRKLFAEHPEKKLSLALSGAFIVILSSLKIPSVTGSSSHPTGTGMGVMLSGPWITAVICTIVLLFQGMFMAHGGFTTLGANVFSMGISGPFVAWLVFRALRQRNVNASVTVFTTAATANMVTYLVTSLQLALVAVTANGASFIDAYITFFGIFAVTQIPIAIAEGVLMVFFFKYLTDVRPELAKDVGYDTSVRQTRSILDTDEDKRKSRVMLMCFVAALVAIIVFVYITTFFFDFGGSDDAGSEFLEGLGHETWTGNLIEFGDFGISVLFLLQTTVGIAILAAIYYIYLKNKHARE
ncbi:MAG: energy-coupling factor ABC transporter permease [Methanomassiliicoccaceae archaeon]|nr:energy-coupling factor ABC transporter permease [Methanomassiliicoccaceae archaeon]